MSKETQNEREATIEDEEDYMWNYPLRVMRNIKEIETELENYYQRVWHVRHQDLSYRVVAKGEYVQPDIWRGAKINAKKIENKFGINNLMLSDFDYGMISGKLSTLRWLTGDEWDNLDT